MLISRVQDPKECSYPWTTNFRFPYHPDRPFHSSNLNRCCSIYLHLLHILVINIQWREIAGLASFRANKDAMVLATIKVPLPLDCAVIFPCGLVERNADPATQARDLRHGANVRYCSSSGIGLGKEANAGRYGKPCDVKSVSGSVS